MRWPPGQAGQPECAAGDQGRTRAGMVSKYEPGQSTAYRPLGERPDGSTSRCADAGPYGTKPVIAFESATPCTAPGSLIAHCSQSFAPLGRLAGTVKLSVIAPAGPVLVKKGPRNGL